MPEENYIITSSCGKPVEDTLPRKKSNALFKELEKTYGIKHDDPEPRNITYNPTTGKFCIIDFELAKILKRPKAVSAKAKALRIQWASKSQQGRRHQTNQDSSICWRASSRGFINNASRGEAILPCHKALFAVSDGVGGNNGGEFASRVALSSMTHFIEKEYLSKEITPEDYKNLLFKTNENVNSKAALNPSASRLSATFAGVIVQENKIMWANVGDSRVYRLRKKTLKQLSNDHNFAFRQMKNGEMSEMEYRLHPRRNQLFDCIGAGFSNINPEYDTKKWKVGDIYLICSDGIIDGLTDNRIESVMTETKGNIDRSRVRAICNELLKQALLNDGSDDTTLVVFQIY